MRARVETGCGAFEIALDLQHAPLTAGYFRQLIALQALDGSSFYRIATEANATLRKDYPIEVAQGGLRDSDPQPIEPIQHEPTSVTGLTHKAWTLSAARYAAGETYGSFFICRRDEPELDAGGRRHPDRLGFAVFGKVHDGFDIVEALFKSAEDSEMLENPIPIDRVRLLGG